LKLIIFQVTENKWNASVYDLKPQFLILVIKFHYVEVKVFLRTDSSK